MKRRDFLHKSAHIAAGTALFGNAAMAKAGYAPLNALLPINPDNDHVLVVIYLGGGNDGLNTVVPLNQLSALSRLRPHVFLPQNQLLRLPGTEVGLHPSLPGLQEFYKEGKLKIIRGVGYPDQNYSHFRSTDIWMSGSDADQLVGSGWLGRYLNVAYPNFPEEYPNQAMPDPLSIEMGYANSLLFQGPLTNMSVVLQGESDFYELVEDDPQDLPDTLYGNRLAHVKLIRKHSQVYGKAMKEAADKISSQGDYPDTSLAQQLKIVARLIAGGMKTPIYKVEIDGFDTHSNQVAADDPTKGEHANLLRELDEAIVAFMKDIELLGIQDRVLGMTFSEFGRRIVSNASRGTDHGAAGPMFFFGNLVDAGLMGTDYNIHGALTYEDNLEYQYDFRQIYGSVLEQWLCVDASDIRTSLLNDFDSLPVVHPSACNAVTSSNGLTEVGKSWVSVNPNPILADVLVTFESLGEHLSVEILDIQGRKIRTVIQGKYRAGQHKVWVTTSDLSAGTYIFQVISKDFRQAKMIQKL